MALTAPLPLPKMWPNKCSGACYALQLSVRARSSALYIRIQDTSQITVAELGTFRLTVSYRPAHLRTVRELLHLKSSLSPQDLRFWSTPSTTDWAAVCLELQSVSCLCSGGTCGCSDRLLNCIKQSLRGAPQSTLIAVKLWMCL